MCLLGFGLVPPVADAEERLVARLIKPSPVSVYGNVMVWSEWRPQPRRYALMIMHGTRVYAAPVSLRRSVFDADVGPDASGRPTAVYSRCQVESPNDYSAEERSFGGGCNIVAHRIGTRGERQITHYRTGGAFLPTIWRDRLVFRRVGRSAVGRLYLRRGRSRPRALRARPPGFAKWLDLRGDRIVGTWERERDRPCPGEQRPDEKTQTDTSVWTFPLRAQRAQRIDRGCSTSGRAFVQFPSLFGRGISYLVAQRPSAPEGLTFSERLVALDGRLIQERQLPGRDGYLAWQRSGAAIAAVQPVVSDGQLRYDVALDSG
jgi:hypothetical protein